MNTRLPERFKKIIHRFLSCVAPLASTRPHPQQLELFESPSKDVSPGKRSHERAHEDNPKARTRRQPSKNGRFASFV